MLRTRGRLPRLAALPALALALALAPATAGGTAGAGAASSTPHVVALPAPVPASAHSPHRYLGHRDDPPTTRDCRTLAGIACYSPTQFQAAYHLPTLYDAGITGRGRTIAVVAAFGSPTIQADLDTFSEDFGLPKTTVHEIQPVGAVPKFDPGDPDRVGWALESTLDVEYAHAIAPDANILLVETPVTETEGRQGFPELMNAELYVVRHGLADVISQSFGATEQTFAHPRSDIAGLRYAFKAAARAGITVLAASGDTGATDFTKNMASLYPFRVISWPSSDPLVTSVGGTQLHLDADGDRTAPDTAWNDGFGASGGGVSKVFARPHFQKRVAAIVGSHRGTPDISMSAAVDGAALVYLGIPGLPAGYYAVGGTSEASPMFAGIVALADQFAEHRLGDLNPLLYRLHGARSFGIVDVTEGNNSFQGVTGFDARKGYDLVTGWGTFDGDAFADHHR
jgi:subtilase family serine protease